MKSWKTTLAGSLAALLNIFAEGFDTSIIEWLFSLCILLLGFISKDFDVTGRP